MPTLRNIVEELYRRDSDAAAMWYRQALVELCDEWKERAAAAKLDVLDVDVEDVLTIALPPRFFQEGNDLSGAYEVEYGMLLWVPDDPDDSAVAATSEDDRAPEVLAVRRYARTLGCDYILFDRDAAICGALPTWEW